MDFYAVWNNRRGIVEVNLCKKCKFMYIHTHNIYEQMDNQGIKPTPCLCLKSTVIIIHFSKVLYNYGIKHLSSLNAVVSDTLMDALLLLNRK